MLFIHVNELPIVLLAGLLLVKFRTLTVAT